MNPTAPAPETSDEEFLDEVFERAVLACESGAEPDVEALLTGREHLRGAVTDLLATARMVTPVRASALPSIPGYTVMAELGRGGMGVVYLARQETLGGRTVALKVLPASAALSGRARERFLAEARSIASVRHPHVVTVHDIVSTGAVHAYAMECVEGASLAQVLERVRRRGRAAASEETTVAGGACEEARALLCELPADPSTTWPTFVCRIGIAVARALGALHAAGLVHRDVKPSNILLRKDGTALLSDFGLVHAQDRELTQNGQFAGTIAYASPEQLEGSDESLDARSDVYALGVTLYHALTLHLPFDTRGASKRASSPTAMLRQIEAGRAPPLRTWNRRLPRDLETVVGKAMEPDPARRYASAGEFADDLQRVLALQPVRARPSGVLARAVKLVRRNHALAWGLGLGGFAALALSGATVVYAFLAPRWVEEHARAARLALLDPAQANAVFNVEFFGVPESSSRVRSRPADAVLDDADAHYAAALRWRPSDAELRAERAVVASLREVDATTPSTALTTTLGAREAGLLAFLRCDVATALACWERVERARDPATAPDPLIETGLGMLHLAREQPARAYPRLREACRSFPDVGYLTTYLADAALQCGDVDEAESLLRAASRMPSPDPYFAHERVTADLHAARGRHADAERTYAVCGMLGPAGLRQARMLDSIGRRAEALDRFVVLGNGTVAARVREECARAVERWWDGLDAGQRVVEIARAMVLDPLDRGSLVRRLGVFVPRASEQRPADDGSTTGATNRHFSAVPPADSSPPLQDRPLPELARTLEVHDMNRWNLIRSYNPLFKTLQQRAWESTSPARASRTLAEVAGWLRARAPSLAFGAVVAASLGTASRAQNCPGAPCFQGLGDLPGGASYSYAYCLSGDGSTVGGGSSTALSAGEIYDEEAFVWNASTGMVYVGDLPGNGESGQVLGLSFDGSVAVGWTSSGNAVFTGFAPYSEAFRWTQSGGLVALGDLPTGVLSSVAYTISDDAAVVLGTGQGSTGSYSSVFRSAKWTSVSGWTSIGSTGFFDSRIFRVSRDGQWGAGSEVAFNASGQHRAVRWSDFLGMEYLSQGNFAEAYGVSNAGVAVGRFGNGDAEACLWPIGGGIQMLGDLAGGSVASQASAITADGTWIGGWGASGAGEEALVWDESRGLHRAIDVLVGAGVSIPAGWTLHRVTDIVRNGQVITICGYGTNPASQGEAWIAKFEADPIELFCFGDGSGTACPCGNNSSVGSDDGCLSSLGTGGRLRASGTARIGADTFVLQGSQMPNSSALYFQGSTFVAGGNGSLFGDGLRCAGSIIRLGTKQNAGGASQYPDVGDPTVSVRGLVVAPGGWRIYQGWYRNAASFCTTSTFNLTNAVRVFWTN